MGDKLELIKAVHEAIMEIVGSSNDQATVRLALEAFQATVNDEMLPVAREAWEPEKLKAFLRTVRGPDLNGVERAIDRLNSALPEAVKAETEDEIDWSKAPEEAMYMARDEDGEAYFYCDEPHLAGWDDEWIADGGSYGAASHLPSYKRGTCDWTDSLVKRPE